MEAKINISTPAIATSDPASLFEMCAAQAVWPVKNRQTSVKLPKNDFTSKIKDFDTFAKID